MTKVGGYEYKYPRGSNAMGNWPGSGWYPCHIIGYSKGNYRLYFPSDGEVLENAPENAVKPAPKKALWNSITRDHCLRYRFTNKDGRTLTVEGIGTGVHVNQYRCSSTDGKKDCFVDIGTVMKQYLRELHPTQTSKMKHIFVSNWCLGYAEYNHIFFMSSKKDLLWNFVSSIYNYMYYFILSQWTVNFPIPYVCQNHSILLVLF